MRKNLSFLLFLLLIIFVSIVSYFAIQALRENLASEDSSATTGEMLYVSTNGTGNFCSQTSPCSLSTAASRATAGTTVILNGGNYTSSSYDPLLTPTNSGTAGNPITYIAASGQTPTLSGGQVVIDITNKSYIVIDGLHVRDSNVDTDRGVWMNIENSNNITVQNSNFNMNQPAQDRAFVGFQIKGSSYTRVLNSRFDNCGTRRDGDAGVACGDAIQIFGGSHHNLFQGNYVGNAGHAGLQIDGGYLNVIRNNTFCNDLEKGLELTHRGNTPSVNGFRWNLVEGNTFTCSGFSVDDHGGMHLHANSSYGIFRNNTFRDSQGWAVDMQMWDEVLTSQGNRFFNNTIAHNGIRQDLFDDQSTTGLSIDDFDSNLVGRPMGSHILKNNIFFDNLPSVNQGGNPAQIFLSYQPGRSGAPWVGTLIQGNSFFYQNTANTVIDVVGLPRGTVQLYNSQYPNNFSNNIQANPLFVNYNVGSVSNPSDGSFDFRLQSNSPAIDAGVDLTSTASSGSGTVVTVSDALYFHDGFDGLITPDNIVIGDDTATITDINYQTNQITLDRSITWANGEAVNLPYAGNRPDIGAFEYGTISNPPPNPTPTPTPTTKSCYRCTTGLADGNSCESTTVDTSANCPAGYTENANCFEAETNNQCPVEQAPTTKSCYRCTASLTDGNACESTTVNSTEACPTGYTENSNCSQTETNNTCPVSQTPNPPPGSSSCGKCGPLDRNGNSNFDILDIVAMSASGVFGSTCETINYSGSTACNDCGSMDLNGDDKINIIDFANIAIRNSEGAITDSIFKKTCTQIKTLRDLN